MSFALSPVLFTPRDENTDSVIEGDAEELREVRLIESQTRARSRAGDIWNLVAEARRDEILGWVQSDPQVLTRRDPVMATPLLLLVLYHSPAHIEIALEIMQNDDHVDRISDQYGEGPYLGENVLHIACVNKNFELAKYLTGRCPKLLSQRATGTFFAPGNPCYYGELPLSFAVSTNQTNMVKMMLSAGADICAADLSSGNTALHMAVLHDCTEQYIVLQGYVKSWVDPKGAKLKRQSNNAGLSCLELCAAKGTKEFFDFLIEESREILWSYGIYPLAELEEEVQVFDLQPEEGNSLQHHSRYPQKNFRPRGRLRQRGAINLMMEHQRLEMLDTPLVRRLIERKWEVFGKKLFQRRLWRFLFVLLIFQLAVLLPRDVSFVAPKETRVDQYSSHEPSVKLCNPRTFSPTLTRSKQPPIKRKDASDGTETAQVEEESIQSNDDGVKEDLPTIKTLRGYILAFISPTLNRSKQPPIKRKDASDSTETAQVEEECIQSNDDGVKEDLTTLKSLRGYILAFIINMNTFRYVCEAFTVIGAMMKLATELKELREYGFRQHFIQSAGALFVENTTSMVACLSILLSAIFRFVSWLIVVFFLYEDSLAPLSSNAPRTLTTHKIMAGDVFWWDVAAGCVRFEFLWTITAALAMWGYLLYFLLGFQSTGPFVLMLQEILTKDAAPFGLIFSVFLCGFTTSFLLADRALTVTIPRHLFSTPPDFTTEQLKPEDESNPSPSSPHLMVGGVDRDGDGFADGVTISTNGLQGVLCELGRCLAAMLGDFDVNDFYVSLIGDQTFHRNLNQSPSHFTSKDTEEVNDAVYARATEMTEQRKVAVTASIAHHVHTGLVLSYLSLVSIVLMNMLIAKMGDTYQRVIKQAEQAWIMERARVVMAIAREMSVEERNEEYVYWVTPEATEDSKTETKYFQIESFDPEHYKGRSRYFHGGDKQQQEENS